MQMLSLPVITIAALSSLQTSIRLVPESGPAMYAICLSVSRFSLSELATRHNYPEPLKSCHCVHTDHISCLSPQYPVIQRVIAAPGPHNQTEEHVPSCLASRRV